MNQRTRTCNEQVITYNKQDGALLMIYVMEFIDSDNFFISLNINEQKQ